MTGDELRQKREQARIRVNELAQHMENRHGAIGVHPSWVSQLEARQRITRTAERRYLRALQTAVNVVAASDAPSAA